MTNKDLVFGIVRKIYAASSVLASPFLLYHLKRRSRSGKEDESRLAEREGVAAIPRPVGRLVWFHCASVGESLAALPVVEKLLVQSPDMSVLLTTGTTTSAQLMAERLPERSYHQYVPYDHPVWIKRFLNHWKPDAAIWVESEFWPNTLCALKQKTIPLMLVNGRVSYRSYRRWRKAPSIIRGILGCFNICLAQTEQDAEYLRNLGARNVVAHGNLKLGVAPLLADQDALSVFEKTVADRPCWLMSSTHEGEEEIGIAIHQKLVTQFPSLLTIIVPRHPGRGDAISASLKEYGLTVTQRSHRDGLTSDTSVYLADTLGELGLFYRACDIVFMGKSLVSPGGGQNPFEPAKLGCAVLFGPHMGNFVSLSEAMLSAGAARQVANADALCQEISNLLNAPNELDSRKKASIAFCDQAEDIIEDTVLRIRALMKCGS